MTADNAFKARAVNASEYIRELFEPADNVAILVRNRSMHRTVQRIAKAEAIAARSSKSGSPVRMPVAPMCLWG